MKLKKLKLKLKHKLPIGNFDNFSFNKLVKRFNLLFPDNTRAVFCGPSNCGKTNAVVAIILHINGKAFMALYNFSKSHNQPKYELLEVVFDGLDEVPYFKYNNNAEIMHPNEVIPYSLMLFDDIQCEKQHNVRSYFSMGRHNSVSVFYLCQSYSKIPKQLIRDNINFLGVFRQDDMNLKHIYDDHVNPDMSFNNFKILCYKVWNHEKHSFLVIDKESEIDNGRYRRNIDHFININEINNEANKKTRKNKLKRNYQGKII